MYTGTHDNTTINDWYKNLNLEDKRMCVNYINNKYTKENDDDFNYDKYLEEYEIKIEQVKNQIIEVKQCKGHYDDK